MKISLKTKLILVVSFLILFVVSVFAVLFLNEKKQELNYDVYVRALSFSELTADDIVKNYELYGQSGAFLNFSREMLNTFLRNEDVRSIQMVSYSGDVLYDSQKDRDIQYQGPARQFQDMELLERVQAKLPSFEVKESGRVVYLKRDSDLQLQFFDERGNVVSEITNKEQIENIVYPRNDRYGLIYDVSYANLDARIERAAHRIVLLALFGILLGFAVVYLFSSGITRNLMRLAEGARIIAKGNFAYRVKVKSRDEIGFLAETFNSMAKDLESSTKAKIYKERVSKELELAAKIQKELLPEKIPKVAGLDMAAGIIPADEIGGDCFDFITVGKSETIMYIGDVTGHGVPSGLVVAVANALIYSLVPEKGIRDVLIRTNEILKVKTSTNMFLTLLMCSWNSSKKTLRYVSAGHERMLHFVSRAKEVEVIEAGGMALGMLPDVSSLLKEKALDLHQDDILLMYSDGITEARSKSGEIYGLKRLQEVLKKSARLNTAEAVKNAILADVKEYMKGAKQLDDITLVVLVRR